MRYSYVCDTINSRVYKGGEIGMKIISQEELNKSKEELGSQIEKLYYSTNKENDDERKRTNNYLQWISKKAPLSACVFYLKIFLSTQNCDRNTAINDKR